MTTQQHQHHQGFSLVELLIVVTLTVMIIAAASTVLVTALLGGGKVNTTKTIKQNGDYAMGQMTGLLRNAYKLLPNDSGQTCQNGMSSIRFQSFDEGITTFERTVVSSTDARVASNSGVYLTSDAVYLNNDLTFNCSRSEDGSIVTVSISFSLTKGDAVEDRITDYGQQDFAGKVTIRSF